MFQSDAVKGKINITCDGWQASTTDAYFAVTGHWIEESVAGKWELQTALLGFSPLHNAHNGERLGQTLFRVLHRLGIETKVSIYQILNICSNTFQVGVVTSDRAKSNNTMMREFARILKEWTSVEITVAEHHLQYVSYYVLCCVVF